MAMHRGGQFLSLPHARLKQREKASVVSFCLHKRNLYVEKLKWIHIVIGQVFYSFHFVIITRFATCRISIPLSLHLYHYYTFLTSNNQYIDCYTYPFTRFA